MDERPFLICYNKRIGKEGKRNKGTFFVILIASVIVGAVMGLIPYFLGRYMGKPELGQLGMIFCALSGLIHWGLPFLVAICFVFAIFLMREDINIRRKNTYVQPSVLPPNTAAAGRAGSMQIDCLSGPLKGHNCGCLFQVVVR